MDILNNREIAILIWLSAFLAYSARSGDVRGSFHGILVAGSNWKVWSPMALLVIYIAVWVYLLSIPGIWAMDQLKNTLMWTVTVAFVSMVRVATKGENPRLLKNWVSDTLKIMVIFEFVVNLPTFPLLGELVFIPVTAILGAMLGYAEHSEEHRILVKPINILFSILGITLTGYALNVISDDLDAFATMQTARDFYTPLLLSFLVLPFFFVLYAVVSYESAFTRIGFAIHDEKLKRYAFKRALLEFRHNIDLLKRWTRNIASLHPSNKLEVRESIAEVKTLWRREQNPPEVRTEEGWSPYAAIRFLDPVDIVADDYRHSMGEWYASSPYRKLGEDILADNVAYYIEGNERAATKLKLVLNAYSATDPELSEGLFRDIAMLLVYTAIPTLEDTSAVEDIVLCDKAEIIVGDKQFSAVKECWEGGLPNRYSRKFIIEHLEACTSSA